MGITAGVRNNVHGQITLRDGSPTPVELVVQFERGDLQVSDLAADLNEPVPVEARGQFITAVHGARIFPQVQFSCWLSELTGGAAPGSMLEFITRTGVYAGNVSVLGTGRPYAIDIVWEIRGSQIGGEDETLELTKAVTRAQVATADSGNTASLQATVYGEVDGTLQMSEIG